MDAFPSTSTWTHPPALLKTKQGGHLQRQGAAVPWTQTLLDTLHKKPMLKIASQEVLGSNIPLVAAASSPDEAVDQGVFQAAETLNAFWLSILINRGMQELLEKPSKTWGKELGKGVIKELTHDQKMWKNFALSAPLFAWLAGIEFFTPLLRNMITLKRTQEVGFSKITNLNNKKDQKKSIESKEDKQERLHSETHQDLVKARMAEYIKLSKRDFAIMLPTAFALFGLGLMGMKHNWKMPKVYLEPPKILEKLLGKEQAREAGFKKLLRKGTDQFMNNLFYTDKQPQKYFDQKGKMDLVQEFLLPNGDWTQGSRLLVALVFALPTYTALSLYSRDDVEKTEIAMRGVAYAIANVLFPNAVEGFLDKHIKEGTHIPFIGGKKNIELLGGILAGSALYAILPMIMIRLTRPWRAKKAEEKQARQAKHAVVS
jgi:hypothetical protein